MSRGSVLRGLTAALLGLLTAAAPGPSADAAGPPPAQPHASGAPVNQLDDYWTPRRMEAAKPAEEHTKGQPDRPAAAVPPSHPFNGIPQVGTFFWVDEQGSGRFCGATVVRSPHHNLVVSAGHCLSHPDPERLFVFVPQYHDGLKPHGIFPVNRIYLDPHYAQLGTGKGARWDYCVVELGPREDGQQVEEVVGGFTLRRSEGYNHRNVRLIGYPGSSDVQYPKPLDCTSSTHRYTSTDPGSPGTFLEIACAGYIGGTSGGPFLIRQAPDYALIGVIGGYHTGGDTADISYSSYFTKDTLALYQHAVRGDQPATG